FVQRALDAGAGWGQRARRTGVQVHVDLRDTERRQRRIGGRAERRETTFNHYCGVDRAHAAIDWRMRRAKQRDRALVADASRAAQHIWRFVARLERADRAGVHARAAPDTRRCVERDPVVGLQRAHWALVHARAAGRECVEIVYAAFRVQAHTGWGAIGE